MYGGYGLSAVPGVHWGLAACPAGTGTTVLSHVAEEMLRD